MKDYIEHFVTGLKNTDESEFDMFAQSRNVTYESSKTKYSF